MRNYDIISVEMGMMNECQLEEFLEALPIDFSIAKGHELPLFPTLDTMEDLVEPLLKVSHASSIVALKPDSGCRLQECFFTDFQHAFISSRIMDESNGGGSCCTYHVNTADLGLGFEYDLTIDIYKLGN